MALRTPLSVTPHLYMGDSTGRPLDKGVVYFGEQDKDPEFYPINLFSDDALTKPLAQPVHTKGGYLYDKGDMVEPHAKEFIYSVKVLDSYGRKVFYKGAMMRNSWNDDVIEQINTAIIDSADAARQVAIDITNDAINNTAVEGGVLADTFVVVDGSLSQRTINKGLESITDLSTINNPKDGLRVYVKSYYAGAGVGGGYFTYDSAKASVDDGGSVINGWVRDEYLSTGSVKLSWYGAIANDVSNAANNEDCLFKAIKNNSVIIDGSYPVTASKETVVANSLSLIGDGNDSGLVITAASTVMWIKMASVDYLKLDKIRIYNELNNTTLTLFSPNEKDNLLGELSITNSYFYGTSRLFRGSWSTTLDANEHKFGVDRFIFNNNTTENTALFLFFINSCTTYSEVRNNTSKNISRLLINFSIDKEDTKYSVKDNLKYMLVDGNKVINDDDFFATDVVGYLCFVLFAGQECVYTNNWVEGLKTRDKAAVYDAYLSALKVYYSNNVWKNNLCFHPEKTLNFLIKAKGAPESTHSNSHYIVEKEFLERHNALGSDVCWVALFEKTVGSDSGIMRIKDNKFDVYWLLHQYGSSSFRSVEITGNSFNCFNTSGTMLIKDANPVDISTFETAYIDVSNNIFNIENSGMSTSVSDAGTNIISFRFFTFRQNEGNTKGFYRLLKMDDNTINIGKVYNSLEIGVADVNNVEMRNNRFVIESADTTAKVRPFWVMPMGIKTTKIEQNTLNLANNVALSDDGFDAKINSNATTKLNFSYVGKWPSAYTYFTKPTSGNCKVIVTRRIISDLGVLNWQTRFNITQDGVTFSATDLSPQTQTYPSTGTANIQPSKKAINASDELAEYNPVTVYPASNSNGVVRMYYNLSGYANKRVMQEVTIEVLPY